MAVGKIGSFFSNENRPISLQNVKQTIFLLKTLSNLNKNITSSCIPEFKPNLLTVILNPEWL